MRPRSSVLRLMESGLQPDSVEGPSQICPSVAVGPSRRFSSWYPILSTSLHNYRAWQFLPTLQQEKQGHLLHSPVWKNNLGCALVKRHMNRGNVSAMPDSQHTDRQPVTMHLTRTHGSPTGRACNPHSQRCGRNGSAQCPLRRLPMRCPPDSQARTVMKPDVLGFVSRRGRIIADAGNGRLHRRQPISPAPVEASSDAPCRACTSHPRCDN